MAEPDIPRRPKKGAEPEMIDVEGYGIEDPYAQDPVAQEPIVEESEVSVRTKRVEPPPLPRLWKGDPPADSEASDSSKAKPKRQSSQLDDGLKVAKTKTKPKKKTASESLDDGTGAKKLEETPVLDTYETRQRIRWIIGGVAGAIGVISLVMVIRTFRGSGGDDFSDIRDIPEPSASLPPPSNADKEAHKLIETARQSAKLGRTKAALDLLSKVVETYPGTPSAKQAADAIERNRQNLPLFGNEPLAPRLASGPKAPPKTPSGPVGSATRPPSVVTPPIASGSNSALPGPTGPTPPKDGLTEAAPSNPASAPRADLPKGGSPGSVYSPGTPNLNIKRLPNGFRAKPGTSVHTSGWPGQILCEIDGSVMVLVPAAGFLMGREDGEAVERPVHGVSLSAYYIDQHEVTIRQYRQFLKDSGRSMDVARLGPNKDHDEFPITSVSFREAKAYCTWAGKRLPTEAQWELAARSPEGKISFWNGELPRKDPSKGVRTMEAVMSLSTDVSAYGVYDLGANAWEWTSEFFDSQSYQGIRGVQVDPTGPATSRAKPFQITVKGGSKEGVLTWRDGLKMESRLPYVGFRGALPVEGAPVAPPVAAPPSSKPTSPGTLPPM